MVCSDERPDTQCAVLPLTDVAIAKLKLIKESTRWYGDQDHSRWVFRTSGTYQLAGSSDVYVKIWNPTYIRRDNILRGIAAGFYDEQTTPALRAVIVHRGLCRGYVMHRCRQARRVHPDFYELVKERTARTGYFHVQFSPDHTLTYHGACSLIDLEAVYPISDLPMIHDHHSAFDWPQYECFVAELFNEAFPHAPAYVGARPGATHPVARSAWRRATQLAHRKARAVYRRTRRWLDVGRANRTDLIDY